MLSFRTSIASAVLALGIAVSADAQEKPARRLESITWSPTNHKLTWTIAQGTMDQGKFVEKEKATYEIDMDEATMMTNGEGRRFAKSEAVSVHALMDLVAKYAAESTLWWDAGQGEPLDKDGRSKVKRGSPDAHGDDEVLPEIPRRRERETDGPKTIRIRYERPVTTK